MLLLLLLSSSSVNMNEVALFSLLDLERGTTTSVDLRRGSVSTLGGKFLDSRSRHLRLDIRHLAKHFGLVGRPGFDMGWVSGAGWDPDPTLHWEDYLVLGVHLTLSTLVGIFVSRRPHVRSIRFVSKR